MLSAFLFTYRLLNDFTKANRDPKQYLHHILNYIIRRFIRIYIYYILFYAAAKYGPYWVGGIGRDKFGEKMSRVMLLGHNGHNHLWKIPAEIKYYAVIPIYCMEACLLSRFSPLLSIVSLLWTILDQYYNIFHLSTDDTAIYTVNTFNLKSHFAVFSLGSQVALSYYLIERNEFSIRIFIRLSLYKPI
jgi:peptidoglycan/LPS O-acetylase OafA/YrhL